MLSKVAFVALAAFSSAHVLDAKVGAGVAVPGVLGVGAGVHAHAKRLVHADAVAGVDALGLVKVGAVADVHVKRTHKARRDLLDLDLDVDIDINLGSVLDTALDTVSPLVAEIEAVLAKVGTVADEVIKSEVEPILAELLSTVEGLAGKLTKTAGLRKRAINKRSLATELAPKVTDLFKEVASVLNTAESIVQSVPIVGGVLGPILLKLNPLLSTVLTALDQLVVGLLLLVGSVIDGILGGLSPLLGGLLGGILSL